MLARLVLLYKLLAIILYSLVYHMLVLGIETSCDETSVAVVRDGCQVLSNIIASQIELHQQTGGVVPEVAAREHVIKMVPVLKQALEEAAVGLSEIDLIAVTQGPGLLSALLTGTTAASVLAAVNNIPIIPVSHIAGHVYANWLEAESEVQFPVLVATVSGGHNELVLLKKHFEFQVLGKTRDDAAGEAFDKVARMLGLGYPGGPAISKAAEQAESERFTFPRAWLNDSYDFSFSGLKTAVLRCVLENNFANMAGREREQFVADVAAGFQEAVVDVLVTKLLQAAEEFQPAEIHIAGGVSANSRLRMLLEKRLADSGLKSRLRYPKSLRFCTDNAAMIAAAGYFLHQVRPVLAEKNKMIVPNLQLNL